MPKDYLDDGFQDQMRNLLLIELERRKVKNSKYSLRAFARDIKISAAFLSMYFAGRRRLSVERAGKVAFKLHLK